MKTGQTKAIAIMAKFNYMFIGIAIYEKMYMRMHISINAYREEIFILAKRNKQQIHAKRIMITSSARSFLGIFFTISGG
jgi:hypothetical protein